MQRREFLSMLAIAAGSQLPLRRALGHDGGGWQADAFYRLPPPSPATISLLHFTDCHAQLLPVWYREPDMTTGSGKRSANRPHRVGDALQGAPAFARGSANAYAFSQLDFAESARRFGQVGGFAHLATLIGQLRASRPDALLLDGGDTWQGSATALWSEGRDMVAACRQLGVDVMTGHWEFTLGAERVRQIVQTELGSQTEFLAQNVHTADFNDDVFKPWTMRALRGVPVAIIGQAYPYTPLAHPRTFTPDWTFGLQESGVQDSIDAARKAGAQVVVLLSHNGLAIDLKLAGRVQGLDAILGGHTHDALAYPVLVPNRGGKTLVTNAGSHGKFLGVLDLDVRGGQVRSLRYRLLPVFANLLPADSSMQMLIDQARAPYTTRLAEPLAITDGLLYRRDTFNGSFDQLILQALMDVREAEIALSPGFRWGTTLLPGETITREALMNETAITYPDTTLQLLTGSAIKTRLEAVADNLFNPDPYQQEGGDMVRVGGLTYACAPSASTGRRISDLRLNGRLLDADRRYRVAGWAAAVDPTDQGDGGDRAAMQSGPPIWEVVATWLRQHPHVAAITPNRPRLST